MLSEWEVNGELEYTEEGYPDYKTNQKSHRQQAIAEALDVYNALANWKTPISRKYFISNFIVRCRKIQKLHQRACQENNLEFPFPDTHITNAEIDAYQNSVIQSFSKDNLTVEQLKCRLRENLLKLS
jgi:hypothetical protein